MMDSTLDINQKIRGLCSGLPWFDLQVAEQSIFCSGEHSNGYFVSTLLVARGPR